MKRILVSLALMVVSAVALFARQAVELSLSYEFSQGMERKTRGNAKLVYMGSSFLLEGTGFRVLNDGVDCWTLNMQSKEAVVDKALNVDISATPQDVLSALGVNSRDAEVEFTRSADGLPQTVSAKLADGSYIEVRVKSSRQLTSFDASAFSLDPSSLDKKWVITDLR